LIKFLERSLINFLINSNDQIIVKRVDEDFMKVVVMGTRPEIIKLAPVIEKLRDNSM